MLYKDKSLIFRFYDNKFIAQHSDKLTVHYATQFLRTGDKYIMAAKNGKICFLYKKEIKYNINITNLFKTLTIA